MYNGYYSPAAPVSSSESNHYCSYGNMLQRSQPITSEGSYSCVLDKSDSVGGSVDQVYPSYPYSSIGMHSVCDTPPGSPGSMPTSIGCVDRYYPPAYTVVSSCGYPLPSPAGYSSTPQSSTHLTGYKKPTVDSTTVAIDNKIEQAIDLVTNHLMYAVREEVEVLKEQIKELIEKNSQLEHENKILRGAASPETLALLNQPRQSPEPPSSSS